jgi:hypothetical protein
MSYVPPSQRTKEDEQSIFVSSSSKPKPKSEINIAQENFPTLGEANRHETNNENENENKISFASSLTTAIPKEEAVKEVPDGWLFIRKDKEPRFLYGEIMTENLKETYKIINELDRIRRDNAVYRTLKNYERYEFEDEMKYGLPTIQSWEVNGYLEEIAMNKKHELLEQEFAEDNDIYNSSEDEYGTN